MRADQRCSSPRAAWSTATSCTSASWPQAPRRRPFQPLLRGKPPGPRSWRTMYDDSRIPPSLLRRNRHVMCPRARLPVQPSPPDDDFDHVLLNRLDRAHVSVENILRQRREPKPRTEGLALLRESEVDERLQQRSLGGRGW